MRLYRDAGPDPQDHFAHISRMVVLGFGAKREIEDFTLTRKERIARKICRNSSKARMFAA